jgi:hypothetical protein
MFEMKYGLLFSAILLLSCKDDDEPGIIYTDIAPDKKITSMIPSPWTFEDVKNNNITFIAGDGTGNFVSLAWAQIHLDLNRDDSTDVELGVRHYLGTNSTPENDKLIFVSWINNSLEVSLEDPVKGYVKKYADGDAIDYASFGSIPTFPANGGFLIRMDALNSLDHNGDFYIAVKIRVDEKSYYGWIHVETTTDILTLTIKEFALHRRPDHELFIGQKE